MSAEAAVRTQAQRSQETITALISAARELFARDGYAATSLDGVVAAAGVTKGALYHHFSNKQSLFAAVFSAEQARLTEPVMRAYKAEADPWSGLLAGCIAFIEASQEPGAQRIVLLDAPGVLSWNELRELEAGCLQLMESGVVHAMDAGLIAVRPPSPLTHIIFGAMCESAMVIARADDQRRAMEETAAELSRMLEAMVKPIGVKG